MKTTHDPRYLNLIAELKNARHSTGLTQHQAALACGWSRTKLGNLESGQRRADILEVYTLAKLYGIRLARLEAVLGRM